MASRGSSGRTGRSTDTAASTSGELALRRRFRSPTIADLIGRLRGGLIAGR
jgi:hypothetical protein